MKTQKVMTVTYLNPNYEPGKTVREITEVVAVVKSKDLATRLEARQFAHKLMADRRITVFSTREVQVPVF